MSPANLTNHNSFFKFQHKEQTLAEPAERRAELVRAVRELDHEIALLTVDAISADDLAVLRPLGRWLDTISLRKLRRKRALTNALAKAS